MGASTSLLQGQVDAKLFLDADYQLYPEQSVPPARKKLSSGPTSWHSINLRTMASRVSSIRVVGAAGDLVLSRLDSVVWGRKEDEFSIRPHRQRTQAHKDGRDHVVRQATQQMLLEFRHGGNGRIFLRQNVGHKPFPSRLRYDIGSGKIDAGITRENDGYLIQFDPLSVNLRLPVEASAKLDLSVRPPGSAIAGAIHARAWCCREWIGQKALPWWHRAGCDSRGPRRFLRCKSLLSCHREPGCRVRRADRFVFGQWDGQWAEFHWTRCGWQTRWRRRCIRLVRSYSPHRRAGGCIRVWREVSPPVSRRRRAVAGGHSMAIIGAAWMVGTKAMVTCSRISHCRNKSGDERTASSARHTVAPAQRCGKISQAAASNPRPGHG